MRVGIFGGAFDPPHLGHEKALKTFVSEARLDLCYVIPSGIPPHKAISAGANDETRLEMASLAFCPLSEKVQVSDMEIRAKGTCYSYLTLEKIQEKHPDGELFLFVGTDQLLAFETWRNFEWILANCTLCIMDRYEDPCRLYEKKVQLEKDFGAHLLLLEEKAYIISSTDIRAELARWGFSDSLSPTVNECITLRGVYGSLSDPRRKKLAARAKDTLSPKRLSHTLSTERETVRLCRLLGLSDEDTCEMALAALLHDLTKEWTTAEHIAYLAEKGEISSPEDLPIFHGISAAYLAKEQGFFSEEAVRAIRYHTTGRPGMGWKEKILYFADYTEELRTPPSCREMRAYFYSHLPAEEEKRREHLDRCVLTVMENTLLYLKEKNIPVHPLGQKALEDMKISVERNIHDFS